MGKKYSRYKNALEKFLASDKGRRFFHITYSVGAAIVLSGALFKLNHYPFGNTVLLVGLGTEVFIFLISAFDRPSKEYPWEEVFPEFATPEQLEQKKYYEERKRQREQEISVDGESEQVVFPEPGLAAGNRFRGNVTTFYPSSSASPSGSNLPTPTISTPSDQTQNLSPDMASASENYISQVNRMSENVEKFNDLTQSLNQLSDVLIQSFKHITDNSEGIGTSTKGYVSQMENLNRNISGLNTIYEIQLKGVSSQIDAIDQINSGLNRIKHLYEGSIPDSSAFRTETEKLAQQLKDLNLVYARMLQAMTVNMTMGSGFSGSSTDKI
jgi:gliding motility-associated protein GldL